MAKILPEIDKKFSGSDIFLVSLSIKEEITSLIFSLLAIHLLGYGSILSSFNLLSLSNRSFIILSSEKFSIESSFLYIC